MATAAQQDLEPALGKRQAADGSRSLWIAIACTTIGAAGSELTVLLPETGAAAGDSAGAPHQEAAAIYRETGDQHHEGIALNNLGAALEEMRDG